MRSAAVISAVATMLIMIMYSYTENSVSAETQATNPLVAEWTGPYGGVPPFDKVKIADFKPAIEEAMEEQLKEINAIANIRPTNAAAPHAE